LIAPASLAPSLLCVAASDRAGFTDLVTRPDPEHERAKEVLNYFVRNPRAADSVEGVARWRLLDQTVLRTVDETHEALEWLVQEGFLCQATSAGAGTIFTLNAERQAQAVRFLEAVPDRAGEPGNGSGAVSPTERKGAGGDEH